MQILRKNLVAIIIVIITIILGAIAIFTAWRLYSIRTTAPTEPAAAVITENLCDLEFTITVESSPSPTGSPTDSPTASPTDSPTSAPTDSPTDAPTTAPTSSPTSAPTTIASSTPTTGPTATPTTPPLPDSGVGTPAIIGISAGAILLLGALLLAL